METGFPKMRYEIVEDGQTIALTDCEVAASVTFAKACQKITEPRAGDEDEEKTVNTVEFKDRVEKKYIRVTYEMGELVE